MDELNYEIMHMINEHRVLRSKQAENAQKLGDKDKYGFPFEPDDAISTNKLGFLETAMRLQTEANETFRFLRNINRHSPLFYKMSSELEKLVGQLGSICITKAVIEQQEGQTFPMLGKLTIDWLREKTAFNFRKCYSSYMESIAFLSFNQSALSLSTRWAALDKRLLATQEKIEKIKEGKISIDLKPKDEKVKDQISTAQSQEQTPGASSDSENTASTAFSPKSHALPIDKSFVPDAELKKFDNFAEAETESAISGQSEEQQASFSENHKEEPDFQSGFSVEDSSENTDETSESVEEEDMSDEYDNSTEENLPYVSEELVRRMSAFVNSAEFLGWPIPEYEYASPP